VTHPDDPEDLDPGLARERTRLAWLRTAISFAAVGLAVLKINVPAGVTVLALVPLVWQAGRTSGRDGAGRAQPRRLLLAAVAVTAVALVALVIVFAHGSSSGFHPPTQARP
jgi:uncharacterized protein DUF202